MSHTAVKWTTPGIAATGESQISPIGWFTHERTILSHERQANARLIASAPELLAACEAALLWGTWTKHTEVERQLKTAIARAQGKE